MSLFSASRAQRISKEDDDDDDSRERERETGVFFLTTDLLCFRLFVARHVFVEG